MSNFIKKGYEVSYLIHPEFIKTRDSGTFQEYSYKPAVTLSAQNVFESINPNTKATDIKKDELSFEISCDTVEESKLLSDFFLAEMKAHRPILLTGSLPYGDKVKCFETAKSFLTKEKK